ncbi:MAG: alpha/beta hydrolase [Ruminococcus sp.]|nr:alpha/beta hydrolase [Ruminococcus sp.]
MIKIILIALCIILVLLTALTLWLPSFVMTGKRQTLEEALEWQSDHYDTSFYDKLEKTDYTISGEDGYTLHVQFLRNPEPTTKYMILSHGYTDNHIGSLKYVPMYLELGFSCVIYDLRGHGENDSTFTTYGIRESADLNALIRDTRERYPDLKVLGLHGESLGAATTVTCMKYQPQVDFAVADCGFSDIDNVIRGGFKGAHLPGFLADLADVGARVRYHYSLKKMRPIDSLDDNEVPILFIHGAEDDFILPRNSEDMYKRTKGAAEFYTIPGAGHAESVLTDPQAYKKYVEEFLQNAGIAADEVLEREAGK